jgi:hypothetical protein
MIGAYTDLEWLLTMLHKSNEIYLLPPSCWFFLGLLFYREDGGSKFLQNVCWLTGVHGVIFQKTELHNFMDYQFCWNQDIIWNLIRSAFFK